MQAIPDLQNSNDDKRRDWPDSVSFLSFDFYQLIVFGVIPAGKGVDDFDYFCHCYSTVKSKSWYTIARLRLQESDNAKGGADDLQA